MSHQGKFDGLTKDLIKHFLGFEEDEENFVRSEQFVLSNLLYHHCLAVNSHAVRRSIDGLSLKFRVHCQENRADKLSDLTSTFLSSSLFKDHYETDIEWSLLSFMLHLSNSPTQVPDAKAELNLAVCDNTSAASSQDIAEEKIDWVSYLLKGEKACVFRPEDPLSDWSDNDEDDYLRLRKDTTENYKSHVEEELSIRPKSESKSKDLKLLEHSHRARSWISVNTHMPYWKGVNYQHEALSSCLVANVASVWEETRGGGGGERSQQLSEWTVIREILWLLMCPVSSYIFHRNEGGDFVVKNKITIPSLTAGAMSKLLEDLCTPLKQLNELDSFIQSFESPEVDPPTPVTVLAYVTGLQQWRRRFQSRIFALENIVKKQETTCTLIWLKDELTPWFRVMSSIYDLHNTAVIAFPEDCSRNVALRLIGSLCEGVEGAGDANLRCVFLRLLLHTLRHYFSIMHSWLVHGALVDFANEFIIQRNESVSVTDESFWREAFSLNYHPESEDLALGDPLRMGLKIVLPLAVSLTSIGKSQELLSALTMKPFHDDNSIRNWTSSKAETEKEKPLEELLVDHVSKIINESFPAEETVIQVEEENPKEIPQLHTSEGVPTERPTEEDRQQKDTLHLRDILEMEDPMLVVDCDGCEDDDNGNDTIFEQSDSLGRKIEAIEDVPHALSVVAFLSSSMRPLITKKQNKLNADLMDMLVKEYQLDRHCRAIRSILLMEAGDVMYEFYTHLFTKVDHGEGVDSISLTLHLEYCISRLYPDLAKLFSVSLEGKGNELDDKEDRVKGETESSVKSKTDTSTQQLSALGLPNISIHYQAPWPMNLVFTQDVMTKFNLLFRFSLSLKRTTHGLERLRCKDMASWNTLVATSNVTEETDSPLQSRLHRLQLLRLWLLFFARELHNYFANVVFLPYHKAFADLIESRPSFSALITDHGKLLNRVVSLCLMGNDTKVSPLQVVLNKVFWLMQQLGQLWIKHIGRVSSEELTSLEAQYVQVHRFIVNLLTHLTTKRFLPHLEGMTRTLANTMPLLSL